MTSKISSWLHDVQERIKSLSEGRKGTVFGICYDDETVTLTWLTFENREGSKSFKFSNVRSVICYKKDLFAVDLICTDFVLKEGNPVLLHEEMNGWEELMKSLPTRLPGSVPFEEWWSKVVFPAFEVNLLEIYVVQE